MTMPDSNYIFLKRPKNLEDMQILRSFVQVIGSCPSLGVASGGAKGKTKISTKPDLYRIEEICSRLLPFCNKNSINDGICVHSPMIKLGLQNDLYLTNNLLSLYAKCFGVDQAHNLFDEMPERDVVSWTGLISAYVKNENNENALELYDEMIVDSDQNPNEYTLSIVLKSCFSLGDVDHGTRAQALIVKLGYESNVVLGSNLIDFYTQCSYYDEAFKVFTYMDKTGDTHFYTRMISSFIEAQKWSQALRLYLQMIKSGVYPNEFTFVKLLSASSFCGLNYGKLVHAHLILLGIELNLVLKTSIVDMYSKCQKMEDAMKVFDLTNETDVFLWTTAISGFAQNSMFIEAINAYREMEFLRIRPNNFTYSGILNACSSRFSLLMGKQVHSRVINVGLENDASVGNALTDMYMKCSNNIEDGLQAFREITSPNVISWTSLISGFSEYGFEQEAFKAFLEMRLMGVQPNSFSLSCVLGACIKTKSLGQITKIHGYIIKTNAIYDIIIGNILIDAYAGLGMVNEAWDVIGTMNHRDAITYTSLATRENQMGHHETALNVIKHMYEDDVKIDEYSLPCFLSASASVPTMESGKQLHCYSIKSGLGSWISVSNALADLYGKCGSIHDLRRAFSEIKNPDVISWNNLIYGLTSNGYISYALSAFDDMRLKGVNPDSITFLLVIFSCSHGGLVDLGLEYFESMQEKHDLKPEIDHYICLVDLLGRSGRLEEAMGVIVNMPFEPDSLIYKTLLGACRLHKNITLGEEMARKGLELNPKDPAFYVLLAGMYDDCGREDLAEKTRKMMREKGLRKNPGQSWIEMNKNVHLFTAGDRSHPQINEIHEKIESFITEFKKRGYEEYHENRDISYHSEKLAVGFGILNLPSNAPIRVIKNLRICKDCHSFMMLVTRILVDREIIIRDCNRFHAFKNGECICKGYW